MYKTKKSINYVISLSVLILITTLTYIMISNNLNKLEEEIKENELQKQLNNEEILFINSTIKYIIP